MLNLRRLEGAVLDQISTDFISGDPIRRFADSLHRAAYSLDLRTDEELRRDSLDDPDPVRREHAVYQLVERIGDGALPTVLQLLHDDSDPAVRINMLWTLQWMQSSRCARIARDLCNDANPRVQEWARVFAWEKAWLDSDFRRSRPAQYYAGRTFDETIFLHIKSHLYIRLSDKNDAWGHVLLSPQMLARIYGQALACPVTETRERELVLSKTLKGLHADGADHYEAFLFRGFTDRADPGQGNFYFEANAKRPFYPSGRAADSSEGVIDDVTIPFAREGQWFVNAGLDVKGGEFGAAPIEYVRGVFQGWAYVNMDRVARSGGEFLFPGNSILGTLHHPEVGPRTNAFIVGSFKGKVVDWNDDGVLDLNYLPAHATRKGEVDSDLDGVPDQPGRSVSTRLVA